MNRSRRFRVRILAFVAWITVLSFCPPGKADTTYYRHFDSPYNLVWWDAVSRGRDDANLEIRV